MRQRATEFDCMVSLREHFFGVKTLDEQEFRRLMYDSLEAQLIAAKGNKAYIMHSAFIPERTHPIPCGQANATVADLCKSACKSTHWRRSKPDQAAMQLAASAMA